MVLEPLEDRPLQPAAQDVASKNQDPTATTTKRMLESNVNLESKTDAELPPSVNSMVAYGTRIFFEVAFFDQADVQTLTGKSSRYQEGTHDQMGSCKYAGFRSIRVPVA